LRRRRIDGLIMTTAAEADPDLTEARRRLDFPVVLFDRDVNGTADCVLVDHAEGIRQATQYLLSLGHRRILLLTGGINTYPARARIEGYKAAHAAVGADIDPALIRTTGFDAITGFRESAAAFEGAQRPTAVIAGGLDMLAGVLKAARARKLRIPQDVSVIGGADSDLAMLATPAVSVVRSDYSELGNACAHLILERIGAAGATTTAPRRIIFPPELVIRDSCAPPADTSAGTTTLA
ncbi:MAG: substrate-binding domain-containing protein, partial [Burkholderiaceae bacterium]|nr:substrate-binding domain-containing protein [Burkholderiaceae bacterium]